MGATARSTKSLGSILSLLRPDHKFGVRKEDGFIICELERLAELDVESSKVGLRWSRKAVQRFSMKKDDATAHFNEKEVIEWCS